MKLPVVASLTVALAGAGATRISVAAEAAGTTLESCAAIAAANERLACYDRYAHRSAVPSPAQKPASSPDLAPKQTAGPTQPLPAVPTAVTAPAVSAEEAFGFYSAEHPVIQTALKSMTATVADFHTDIGGHQFLTLDNGQLWRLDGTDELLAKGNGIMIKRAALGSFILKTQSGRTFHATRLR
jgi:hypothetical protein